MRSELAGMANDQGTGVEPLVLPRPPALLAAVLDEVPHGLLLLDAEGRVVAMNAGFRALAGLAVAPGDALPAAVPGSALAATGTRAPHGLRPLSWQAALANGRTLDIRWSRLAGEAWLCCCEDVTERQHSERRLAHMARHDPLTDLPNRAAFHDALQGALRRLRPGEDLAVLCVDLDRFKQVNETMGPRVADALLREAGQRLRIMVREEDMVARLGSDEFALLLAAPRGGAGASLAEAMARRMLETFMRPFETVGGVATVGASAGIALAGGPPGTDIEEFADALLRRAQLALSTGKAERRGGFRFFADGMDTAALAQRALETDLRQALERDQFELHFQPMVSVRERCVIGFEALLRWRHPARGLVPPDAFIPLAEELGLIVPIGNWVLRRACAVAATWPETASGKVSVAVNLSSVQFGRGDLVEQVAGALLAAGLPGDLLELEITESVLLADNTGTLETLTRLRALGVRISLDDFGTGYSSLAYLNSFPVDKLKIDKRFVHGLDVEPASGAAAIVRAIAGLGVSLGLETTAEGVETRDQLDRLVADGCTQMQGYFFSPPCRPEEVPALLEAVARRAA